MIVIARTHRPVVLAGLLAVSLAVLCAGCGGPASHVGPGTLTPVAAPTEFDRRIAQAGTPVLVNFYLTNCPWCRQVAPVLDQLAGEYAGRAEFLKVNGDTQPDLARRHGVQRYPTILIFVRGQAQAHLEGARGEGEYRQALDRSLAAARRAR